MPGLRTIRMNLEMKRIFAVIPLALLAACQTAPKPEDDTRYLKLASWPYH